MASLAQLAANQQNALRSTGPRSASGKVRSSLNSLKHGLLSRAVVMASEDRSEFDALNDSLRAELGPEGDLECLLLERITAAVWRLRRVLRIEAGILDLGFYSKVMERENRRIAYGEGEVPEAPALYLRSEEAEEPYRPALDRIQRCLAALQGDQVSLARGFVWDAGGADALGRLTRYEAAIERGLFRALHEMQRLQAAWREPGVHPPLAVDLRLNGGDG